MFSPPSCSGAMHAALICLYISIRFVSVLFVIVVVSGNTGKIYFRSGMVRKEELYLLFWVRDNASKSCCDNKNVLEFPVALGCLNIA